jgi:hypothetical protein
VNALRRADGDLARMALDAGLVTALEGRYKVEERLAGLRAKTRTSIRSRASTHEAVPANLHSAKRSAASRSTRSP